MFYSIICTYPLFRAPAAPVTQWAYDAFGELTMETDASNNATTYGYDSLSRQTSNTNTLGQSRTFGYDAAGNQTLSIDRAGAKRVFAYDNLNRQTTETWLNASQQPTRSFVSAYDVKGQLGTRTEKDGAGTTLSANTYAYDANGDLLTDDNLGTLNLPREILTGVYDIQGRRTMLTTSVNGSTDNASTTAYDNLDRATSISQSGGSAASKQAVFAYDNAGHETSLTRYNTSGAPFLTTTYAYDAAGRLSLMQNLLPGGTTSYSYGYDADSRTMQMQQTATWDNYTANYTYDNEGQITGAVYTGGPPTGTTGYAYDANGNRVAASGTKGANGSYTHVADNRLTNDGTYAYTYDNEGRRLTRTTGAVVDTYAWDARGRLTGITTASSGTTTRTVSYVYDAMDRRIGKQILDGSGVRTFDERFAYDGSTLNTARWPVCRWAGVSP